MTQPPTQSRGSSADIAWLDSRINALEAEVERLEVYEALYNGMRGDYVKVKDEIQRLRELAERRGSTTAKGEH